MTRKILVPLVLVLALTLVAHNILPTLKLGVSFIASELRKCPAWESFAQNKHKIGHLVAIANAVKADPSIANFNNTSRFSPYNQKKSKQYQVLGFDWSVLPFSTSINQSFISPIGDSVGGIQSGRYENIRIVQFGYGRDFIEIKVEEDASFSDYTDHFVHHDVTLAGDKIAVYCT